MSNKFKITTVENKMLEVLDRIKSDKFHDKNLSPYSIDLLNQVKDFFEEIEDYESCLIIQNKIKQRFSHEMNYK